MPLQSGSGAQGISRGTSCLQMVRQPPSHRVRSLESTCDLNCAREALPGDTTHATAGNTVEVSSQPTFGALNS